jgi:23S rRNA pseudouridine2605 synthase
MRLQQFLALAGVASRRRCEKVIVAGRVRVNGQIVHELGTKVTPERDTVEVDGNRVKIQKKLHVLLYKPKGYLSTTVDSRGRDTVTGLVADLPVRVYPVGRLDMDTDGVLLMTNDGELSYRLMHPRFGVEKVYRAQASGKPSKETIEILTKGVDIGGVKTSPAKVRLITSTPKDSVLEITVHEGRKRQIKRMCKAVGHPVLSLTRVEFGGIRVGNLRPGHYRLLSDSEVSNLRNKVSLEPK